MVVSYNTKNHLSVIFQRKGSHFHKILPHCLLVVLLTIGLHVIRKIANALAISWLVITPQGHNFVTVIMSFLLVTRVNMSLTRYNDARISIERMYCEIRELLMNACIYTNSFHTQQDIEWRHEVAYRSLILLRSVMVLLKYNEQQVSLWDLPELNGYELDYVKGCNMADDCDLKKSKKSTTKKTKNNNKSTSSIIADIPSQSPDSDRGVDDNFCDENTNSILPNVTTGITDDNDITSSSILVRKYRHSQRTVMDENLRVPIRIEYLLRTSIQTQISRLSNELNVQKENRLLATVDNFMQGYYSIRRFLTTPTPFPLIQMTRTLLFAYVYTIPFVLLGDSGNLVYHSVAAFIITYGFIGLEFVAIELDDPFGSDDNDIDSDDMADKTFEDVYLNIYDIDGQEWTDKLQKRMMMKSS